MKHVQLKEPAFASLALAFASFGDAFLYPFLPLYHATLGIPLMWVGVLLSINRFVRIFSNGFMVQLLSRYGLRPMMILAVMLAILSTLGYGFASGVIAWISFRICWGLSFSAMRIGTLGYALTSTPQGTALGISRSLQELGPMTALFIAPWLLNTFSVSETFVMLSAISLPALYFAIKLPAQREKPITPAYKALLKFPSTFNAMTLVSSMVIDGIIIVALGVLFTQHESVTPLMATALAAGYLGYRRICLVALSAAGGWLSDRIGIDRIFHASLVMMIVGLLFLVCGYIATGAVVVFTFYSVYAATTPGAAVQGQTHALAAAAENATWRDMGAAIGTLLGGILIASPYLIETLVIAIFVLLALFLVHLGTAQKAIKFLYLWK